MSGARGKSRRRAATVFCRSGAGSYDQSSTSASRSVQAVEPAHHVEEQGAGEDQAVDAVEDAAVTGDQDAHVLHADVALDEADREVAELTADPDDQARQHELQRAEVREAEPEQPGQQHRYGERAERAAERLVGADLLAQLAAAEELPRGEGGDVVALDREEQ